MDIETMMSGAEGTADTGTTDTRTGEQMLADAFAEYGSGNSGEVADPTDADGADATDPAGGEDGGDPAGDDTADTSGESDGQGKDKNAIYADARRRAEAKLQREREAFEKEKAGAIAKGVNEQIALMGLVDPKTQKPIVDAEGMRAYRDALASKRMEQTAQSKGMTAEELNELVSLHPSVMAAKEAQQQLARQAEETKRQAAETQLREDVAAIGKINPDIKSFGDLRKLDRFDAIYEKIKRGYSVADAYMTEYRDALSDARVREAEQRVRNGTAGKSHMQRMEARGDGGTEVPNEEVSLLSRLTGKSPEDARKSLSRFHK